MDIRSALKLVEGSNKPPKLLYHGTNIVSACCIAASGEISAEHPVDDDDLGAVVCTSSSKKIARMFAVEFERFNSRLPVGVLFALDGAAVFRDIETIPYEAETASENEFEYRVKGNVPLVKYCVGVRFVGKTSLLKSERFLENTFEEHRNELRSFMSFVNSIEKLRGMVK